MAHYMFSERTVFNACTESARVRYSDDDYHARAEWWAGLHRMDVRPACQDRSAFKTHEYPHVLPLIFREEKTKVLLILDIQNTVCPKIVGYKRLDVHVSLWSKLQSTSM